MIDPSSQSESMTLAASVFSDFRDEMLANVRHGRLRFSRTSPSRRHDLPVRYRTVLASEPADEIRSGSATYAANLCVAVTRMGSRRTS